MSRRATASRVPSSLFTTPVLLIWPRPAKAGVATVSAITGLRPDAALSDPVATLHRMVAPQLDEAPSAVLAGPRTRSQQARAAARPGRRVADGGGWARGGRAPDPQPGVRPAADRAAEPQRHARHRRHLRGHRPDGAGVAVGGQDAALPRGRGTRAHDRPAGAHHGHLGRAVGARAAAVLPRRLQLPRPERRARARHRSLRVRPGGRPGRRRSAGPLDPHDLARHPRPLRPALPRRRPRHHRAHRQRRGARHLRLPRARAGRPRPHHLDAARGWPGAAGSTSGSRCGSASATRSCCST